MARVLWRGYKKDYPMKKTEIINGHWALKRTHKTFSLTDRLAFSCTTPQMRAWKRLHSRRNIIILLELSSQWPAPSWLDSSIDRFTVVAQWLGLWMAARLPVTLFWYKALCFSYANAGSLASQQHNLHDKNSEVRITGSLAAIHRPGHWVSNCKMAYW